MVEKNGVVLDGEVLRLEFCALAINWNFLRHAKLAWTAIATCSSTPQSPLPSSGHTKHKHRLNFAPPDAAWLTFI